MESELLIVESNIWGRIFVLQGWQDLGAFHHNKMSHKSSQSDWYLETISMKITQYNFSPLDYSRNITYPSTKTKSKDHHFDNHEVEGKK